MTFYQQQILKIKRENFSKEYIYEQAGIARKFIEKNYRTDIDLRQIAASAHFSLFHFVRLFKKIYGVTPYQYLTEVRMEKAKELLLSGKNPKQVCRSVGFSSVTSFTSLFKKYTATTPSAFVKREERLRGFSFIFFSWMKGQWQNPVE